MPSRVANTDDMDDRLVVAYGYSEQSAHKRDMSRIQGFLGGGLDVNLFPQRPELNRGRSEAGRVYRRMEKYAADHPGTFAFSRLIYSDNSWVPSFLEYGILMPDGKLWVEWFKN